MEEITFRQFAALMGKRKRTVDGLVEFHRGKIDDPRDFFERVMSCQHRNPETRRYEDRGDVVIPYASVVAFYQKERHFYEEFRKMPRSLKKQGTGNVSD